MARLAIWYQRLLLFPALLPLLFVQGMMYPLLAPKTLALRGAGVLLLALFIWLALSGSTFYLQRLRLSLAWIPGVLLVLAYVSSFFGADFSRSFWSTFERGDGLLTLTVCIGYFYLILISAEASFLRRLLRLTAWVGSIAAVYLIMQWVEVNTGIDLPGIVLPNGRIGGTLGNAAFLAAYLGMALFTALLVALDYTDWRRRALFTGAGLMILSVFLTATRGTIFALAVVGIGWIAYVAFRKEVSVGIDRRVARYALVSIAVFGSLFFAFRSHLTNVPFEPVSRIASISLDDPTVASRLFIWQSVSREAARTHPFLGYGAEQVYIPFNKVYDPTQIGEEWFDRSHDTYLDAFVQYGVGGLLLFLALIALFVRSAFELRRIDERTGNLLLGLLFVYALQNIFVFDTAVTLWLFFAILAAMLAQVSANGTEEQTQLTSPLPILAFVCALIPLTLLLPVVITPLRANLLAFESYQYQVVDVPRANAAAEKGITLDTYADLEFGYNAYFIYTENQITYLSGDELVAAYESAVATITESFKLHPYDARTALYLAQVIASAPKGVEVDKELLASAVDRTIRLSPKRAQAWYILANFSIEQANHFKTGSAERAAGYAAARDILARYIALVPDLAEPRFVLAQLAYASGDTEAAAQEAAQGLANYRYELSAARRAVAYYGSVGDIAHVEVFLSDIVARAPDDYASTYDLAKVKFVSGDPATALEIVKHLREVAPEVVVSDPDFSAAIETYERSLQRQ